MTSPLLALFTRSLREDTRSPVTYWTRGALVGLIQMILLILALVPNWAGAPGRSFFVGIVSLQLMAITFVGLHYFAAGIMEEKEEQTLGLLRSTDLNPLSILLGKSTSRLCGALLFLAAQMPFTIFAVTLGGVSLGQIFATYCTLGAYTFLLCNIALLGSVISRGMAGAAIFSIAMIAALFCAGPVVGDLHDALLSLGGFSGLLPVSKALWAATPIARLIEVFTTGFAGSPAGWQVWTNLALGLVFFLCAWAAFGKFCDRTSSGAEVGIIWRRAPFSRWFRPPRPSWPALVWKDYYFLFGGRMGMLVRILVYGSAFLYAGWQALTDSGLPGMIKLGSSFLTFVPFIFSIDTAAMAASMFRSELNDRTLSALAGLPRSMKEIAYRKSEAFLFASIPGAACTMLTELLYAATPFGGTRAPDEIGVMLAHTISSWASIVLLIHIVVWLSLWVRRGAMPLGYVLSYVFEALISAAALALLNFGATFSVTYMLFHPVVICVFSIVATGILHRRILSQLEEVAGNS